MQIQYLLMRRESYLLILMFVVCMAGAFYLGSWTTTNNTQVISQQIYNQGFASGEAAGMNKMQIQCSNEVRSIAANCKVWENPDLRFQNLNSTTSVGK